MDLSSMLNDAVPAAPKTLAITNNKRANSDTTKKDNQTQNRENTHHITNSSSAATTPQPTNNNNDPSTKGKAVVYQLTTSVHYLVSKDPLINRNQTLTPPPRSNTATPPAPTTIATTTAPSLSTSSGRPVANLLSSPFRPPSEHNSPRMNVLPASPNGSLATVNLLRLGLAVRNDPSLWKTRLSLKLVINEQPVSLRPSKKPKINHSENNLEIPLKIHEIIIRGDEPKVLLEDVYEIQGAYPRGYFVMMAKRNIMHNFVFAYPDHPWFEDLYGLRKSAYICMRTEEGELYELHLKPSRDKLFLFGYMIKHSDMIRIVKDSMNEIVYQQRKLPLVLDLDDTLVRLVGEGNDRYVPEAELPKCRDRVANLKDGRRVVLTERVHEFLEWAQNLYDISVCSLGDQNYVENVVEVLDPNRTRIRGILYSARMEHDYIKKSPDPGRPPKDLLALYSFCALKDRSIGSAFSLPLILDDETRMWPVDQHDNIIEVISQRNAPVWSVSLFPVVKDTLEHIHAQFFRQFDSWTAKCQEAEQYGTVCTRLPPSAVAIYKTYLRHILRDLIAKGPYLYNTNNHHNNYASNNHH
ncbi:RNA polymerase II [Rhizopus stolonifer]|uniref:protein-serine/threonine phosphatase n=1 Tax=Rhizopus stolonifer TaxID=4846 RepID=A0A367KQP9_RHIST|nr:RNA polymerase II [Rhizopus stolonifer]